MRLKDLLITLPFDTKVSVWVAGDDRHVQGGIMQFLAHCEYRHMVVKSVIPGNPVIVGCRVPKKRRVKHGRPAVAPEVARANVIDIKKIERGCSGGKRVSFGEGQATAEKGR
jgi:hypothetical protein